MTLPNSEKEFKKLNIDELTHIFMESINDQNIKLMEGIEWLIQEDFDKFASSLKEVIQTAKEEEIKKSFESRLYRSKKSSFTKADRLKLFSKINEIKDIGEFVAHRLLLYKVIFPDDEFKNGITNIKNSLKDLSNKITSAVKLVSIDLEKAYETCEEIKEERRKMRKIEWNLLDRLWNYDMDYLSRTYLYLKELIEDIMMMADHIKNFSEYIQFLSTKYLIFK
ncbi:MAG: DUF47 family protein [Candidatus Lokiarchaeota archaeon]|nr:DUF47 family protein [Candidatus Lokiarchaeota archaeon]